MEVEIVIQILVPLIAIINSSARDFGDSCSIDLHDWWIKIAFLLYFTFIKFSSLSTPWDRICGTLADILFEGATIDTFMMCIVFFMYFRKLDRYD